MLDSGTRARQNNTYILGNLWHFHQAHLLPVAVDQGPVAVGLLNWYSARCEPSVHTLNSSLPSDVLDFTPCYRFIAQGKNFPQIFSVN